MNPVYDLTGPVDIEPKQKHFKLLNKSFDCKKNVFFLFQPIYVQYTSQVIYINFFLSSYFISFFVCLLIIELHERR